MSNKKVVKIYGYTGRCCRMWPDWSRSSSSGAAMDRYASDEEEGSGDNQRRKRRTGERSVFDRFIGE